MKIRNAIETDVSVWCAMRNQLWPKEDGVHRNEIEKGAVLDKQNYLVWQDEKK